jgi:hypothetical protein
MDNYIQLPPEELIFITAQPGDTPRFLWELEVQFSNFLRLGIDPKQIHALLGYIQIVPDHTLRFVEKYYKTFPHIHLYPDKRQDAGRAIYQPSIRPHLLSQHFKLYPSLLTNSPIFYHDSDIIFQKLPDFNMLCGDNVNYVSDTRSYLNAEYIESKGEGMLEALCKIAEVDPEVVRSYNENTGGAQYLLKDIHPEFWDEVEKNSVRLYTYMVNTKPVYAIAWAKLTGKTPQEYHEIQAWTADMWALFFNLLKHNKIVKISPELSFSWATSDANSFYSHNIFHNAGVTGPNLGYFYKGDYITKSPFDTDHSYVNPNTASKFYVDEFKYVKN